MAGCGGDSDPDPSIPAGDAVVTLVPEKFMGSGVKQAQGTTSAAGSDRAVVQRLEALGSDESPSVIQVRRDEAAHRVAGLIGGIWLGLRLGGKRPVGQTLKHAGIAVLAIVALAGAGLAIQYYSVPHRLEYDGAGASLEFELRVPVTFALPADPAAIDVTLDTADSRLMAVWLDPPMRRDGDWQILSGTVELYDRTSKRLLVFQFPDGRDRIFRPALAAKPDPEQGWSEWRQVDLIGLPNQPQTVKPGPDDPLELRYRVRVWGSE